MGSEFRVWGPMGSGWQLRAYPNLYRDIWAYIRV